MKRTGILLVQLGTPDSPKTSDVRRYLSEFLNDPRVIDLPWLSRILLVNAIIVPFRAPKSAKIYRDLWSLCDGRSPLLTHSKNVQNKLSERFLNDEIKIHLAMRYQNPSMYDILAQMREEKYDRIVILPLFPHYASATTGSVFDLAMKIMRKWWVIPEVVAINQFWDNEGYIDSVVECAKQFDLQKYDHVLFSYHGLPERHVDKVYDGSDLCSDQSCEKELNDKNKFCYKATCYATTRLITRKLNIAEENHTVCFQSRLNKKWLTPFSDEIIAELAQKGAKKILVFSPSFVADCLETLIEIGEEYQEIFEQNGGEQVQLVPSSNDNARFIDGLEELIKKHL
jgi:ferrochelatase